MHGFQIILFCLCVIRTRDKTDFTALHVFAYAVDINSFKTCFCFQLLGNMALWDGLVAQNVLKELMLDKLLNRYLMMTLLNESSPKHVIQKCKKVFVLCMAHR